MSGAGCTEYGAETSQKRLNRRKGYSFTELTITVTVMMPDVNKFSTSGVIECRSKAVPCFINATL
jgi:hypothetical protein